MPTALHSGYHGFLDSSSELIFAQLGSCASLRRHFGSLAHGNAA
jgi:hypothetical protein